MITVIAEKPSVAKDLARILKATSIKDGYLEGNGYYVTWAFGHLITLAMPSEYGMNASRETLPMLPKPFKLVIRNKRDKTGKMVPDTSVNKQLKIINELFSRSSEIIEATDSGREGELIFRYIFDYLHCSKPFRRLWISSLTDKAIREGLSSLRPSKDYDLLYDAGRSRSEADWLIGLNASSALTIAAGGGRYSLGRVQTPTLRMICERFIENRDFVPAPYWVLRISLVKDNKFFSAETELYKTVKDAETDLASVQKISEAQVKQITSKTLNQEPPLLYDLTSLQKDANTRHGFSADHTLCIAQILYEKKYITYPRTGSRYIPDDVYELLRERITNLLDYSMFSYAATNLLTAKLNRRSVNAAKVTDHHALLPTENLCKETDLTGDEKTIYEMIAGRMLEAVSDKCIKENTVVLLDCAGKIFKAKGTVIKFWGWRNVRGKSTDEEQEQETTLPTLAENEQVPVREANIDNRQTKPKPLLTEASLLSAMESAGKELSSDEEREAMKDCGLGTPATRASIIEALFQRDYISKQKKSLVPTDKGLSVYQIVKTMTVSDVAMTGNWEKRLAQIEKGEYPSSTFHDEIVNSTRTIVSEILTVNPASLLSGNNKFSKLKCPVCGKELRDFSGRVSCTDRECKFVVWKQVAGKNLTENQIIDLLVKRRTSLVKGFKSTKYPGKTFDACLTINAEGKVIFESNKK